ncbi:MAG: Rrf2 family transcriptional regulator [Candidatus Omnitrophica bacterium]|nr:Rrf2 family transcriptional regulator [Candidatus Omnitrophota bacterium]
MKLITRDTDYALRAVCFIVKNKKTVSVPELVRELNIPRPFLRKILQVLSRKGIVRSFKGKGGGFTLGLPPEKIYLLDLLRIFQGPLKLNECTLNKKRCPKISNCPLSKKLSGIEKQVLRELKPITIASLIKGMA